jgi:ATP-binding cassette, sub-family E, member 1
MLDLESILEREIQ